MKTLRKVIQIVPCHVPPRMSGQNLDTGTLFFALADDGSMWARRSEHGELSWVRIAELPMADAPEPFSGEFDELRERTIPEV